MLKWDKTLRSLRNTGGIFYGFVGLELKRQGIVHDLMRFSATLPHVVINRVGPKTKPFERNQDKTKLHRVTGPRQDKTKIGTSKSRQTTDQFSDPNA